MQIKNPREAAEVVESVVEGGVSPLGSTSCHSPRCVDCMAATADAKCKHDKEGGCSKDKGSGGGSGSGSGGGGN